MATFLLCYNTSKLLLCLMVLDVIKITKHDKVVENGSRTAYWFVNLSSNLVFVVSFHIVKVLSLHLYVGGKMKKYTKLINFRLKNGSTIFSNVQVSQSLDFIWHVKSLTFCVSFVTILWCLSYLLVHQFCLIWQYHFPKRDL